MDSRQARREVKALLIEALGPHGFRTMADGMWLPLANQIEGIILWGWTIPPPYTFLGSEPLLILRQVEVDHARAQIMGEKPSRRGTGVRASLYKLIPGRTYTTGAWWFPLENPSLWLDPLEDLVSSITSYAVPFFTAHASEERLAALAQSDEVWVPGEVIPLFLWFAQDRAGALQMVESKLDTWRAKASSEPAVAPHHINALEKTQAWMLEQVGETG